MSQVRTGLAAVLTVAMLFVGLIAMPVSASTVEEAHNGRGGAPTDRGAPAGDVSTTVESLPYEYWVSFHTSVNTKQFNVNSGRVCNRSNISGPHLVKLYQWDSWNGWHQVGATVSYDGGKWQYYCWESIPNKESYLNLSKSGSGTISGDGEVYD